MALAINWTTKRITIPQADLTLIGGTLYELDTDAFRLALKSIEESEAGAVFPDIHRHSTAVTVAGTTFARVIEIINGYSVAFENGAYTVRLAGSNNNLFDVENGVLVQNTVQVIAQNSAGLIVTDTGGGGSAPTAGQVAAAVWASVLEGTLGAGDMLRVMLSVLAGRSTITDNGDGTYTIRYKSQSGLVDRVVGEVDADEQRTGVVVDPD